MGIVLKAAPEALIRMAGEMEGQLENIRKQLGLVEREIARTSFFWEGEAGRRHQSLLEGLKEDLGASVRNLKRDPEILLQMAGLYKKTESESEEAVQALSADIIV